MSKYLRTGTKIPEFTYDTPHHPQKSFHQYLQDDKPVIMVLLRNFGHPITRHYLAKYIETIDDLRSARLMCVVRSGPQSIERAIPDGYLPFEIVCDARGDLHSFFEVPTASKAMSYSWQAFKIFSQAKKEGYKPPKGEEQLLPLTALIGQDGRTVFAHYGTSLTDLPQDCDAMEDAVYEALQQWKRMAQRNEQRAAQQGTDAYPVSLHDDGQADQAAAGFETDVQQSGQTAQSDVAVLFDVDLPPSGQALQADAPFEIDFPLEDKLAQSDAGFDVDPQPGGETPQGDDDFQIDLQFGGETAQQEPQADFAQDFYAALEPPTPTQGRKIHPREKSGPDLSILGFGDDEG